MNKYEVKIVKSLLKKYYHRKAKYKDNEVHRRINLPIQNILKDYAAYNVNLEEKELVNKAIKSLEEKGYISTKLLKFSEDYEKVYLIEERIQRLEDYAAKDLEITPRTFVAVEINSLIKQFKGNGAITDFYIEELENQINNSAIELDFQKEKDLLETLRFLENNQALLYIREASILIFSDSKYLEKNRKEQINAILAKYYKEIGDSVLEEENLFERFNVYDTDQDICIKGSVTFELNNRKLDISGLDGGVSFSIKDLDKISSIFVNCDKIITIENKTSFLRMNDGNCYIYLGGFATKPQISFIKKLIEDNPNKYYYHFGDIDAGGFWIHKKLCEKTNHHFSLLHMNSDYLKKEEYKEYCKKLTENDKNRLSTLVDNPEYSECIGFMLDNNVKLEQEIISLLISHN